MRIELAGPESELWNQALARIPHDFYHLPGYVRLAAGQEPGGEPWAFIAEEGESRLIFPFVLRPIGSAFDLISPYGYPGPVAAAGGGTPADSDFVARALEGIIGRLRERKVISAFLRLHPILGVPVSTLAGLGRTVQHGETVYIDLGLSDEEIWRQIRPGHRHEINRARKEPQLAEIDPEWKEFDSFCEIYTETMRRVGADPSYFFSREYFAGLRRALGDRLHLCVVRIEGEVACAGLFTEVCGTIQYHLSGTRERFVPKYPTKIMLDFIRIWGKKRGNRILHLGGGLGGRKDSLYDFKAGFSKLRKPFYSCRIIVNESAYSEQVSAWRARSAAEPDGPEGFFPAYRKPIDRTDP